VVKIGESIITHVHGSYAVPLLDDDRVRRVFGPDAYAFGSIVNAEGKYTPYHRGFTLPCSKLEEVAKAFDLFVVLSQALKVDIEDVQVRFSLPIPRPNELQNIVDKLNIPWLSEERKLAITWPLVADMDHFALGYLGGKVIAYKAHVFGRIECPGQSNEFGLQWKGHQI
jgi:hypothetical protein